MPMPNDPDTILSDATAARALFEHWAVQGTVLSLPGERDRNFRVRNATGKEFILKFAPPGEPQEILEMQVAAMDHLVRSLDAPPIPRVVRTVDGHAIASIALDGETRAARLLTWLPGEPLALAAPHTADLLHHLGRVLGSITAGLSTFAHPAVRRPLKWDLSDVRWCREHLHLIADAHRRELVVRILSHHEHTLQPALQVLRRSVVHNDANDYNVLVTTDDDGRPTISGIVDFGDMMEAPLVCDVAIAAAYVMLGKPDPISAAVPLVAGYHETCALDDDELQLILPLARTRLAVSVVNSTLQSSLAPGNEYLRISEADAWEALHRLADVSCPLAGYRFREACGRPVSADAERVRDWLQSSRQHFAPLVEGGLGDGNTLIHDFSVGSETIGDIDTWRDQNRFAALVSAAIAGAGRRYGIGRYDEARAIYTTDLFRVEGNDGPEWRTVHLGMDVSAPAGTVIHAPLAGVVRSACDNPGAGDYGPTIMLEHAATLEHPTFWTLYGHLSHASLDRVAPGTELQAGDLLGWVGETGSNGGWWPHVHIQVICDLLGREGDYPGVARPAERGVLLALSPDPSPLLGLSASAGAPRPASMESLQERRNARIGSSLSVSYRRPLHIVRGVMQHLIDQDGRRYLDAVNNVAHVGHEHPYVVRAGQRQMAVLNTNTRYLHEIMLEYAERLTATLPEPLRVCYFVNSGSEANELALRLARAYTASRDVIVLSSGYHGNTTTLVDVSSYKFDGPGGEGPPPTTHVVPAPDTFRGPFRAADADAGRKYAQAVRGAVKAILQAGSRPSAFLCESILSCAGQVMLPPGYLAESYRHVRAAGGLCIADEVQVGLGRVGTEWWAFQLQGVVPDIVTMGKPLGNGHPLGVVVTTAEVASRFDNGMEYFNTFGGNPVSCAVGRAVLDVMEREGLREQAVGTGGYLMDLLRDLQGRHVLVGDVRGAGLFIGVELVTDREERTPAGREATYLANRMRDRGVLMSTDGPHHNVLKIKPPLCFTSRDADQLVETMEVVLEESPLARVW